MRQIFSDAISFVVYLMCCYIYCCVDRQPSIITFLLETNSVEVLTRPEFHALYGKNSPYPLA